MTSEETKTTPIIGNRLFKTAVEGATPKRDGLVEHVAPSAPRADSANTY